MCELFGINCFMVWRKKIGKMVKVIDLVKVKCEKDFMVRIYVLVKMYLSWGYCRIWVWFRYCDKLFINCKCVCCIMWGVL